MQDKYSLTTLILLIALTACNIPIATSPTASTPSASSPTSLPTEIAALPSDTPLLPTVTPAPSRMPTLADTAASTTLPSPSLTPTITGTPGPSLTPTFDFPDVTVLEQANCRYGPGTAYLYAYGLYKGDAGEVRGRNYNTTWLYIQPANTNRFCWVSKSVVEVHGDISTVRVAQTKLPGPSVLYSAPKGVKAEREGNKVTVSWTRVKMTQDDDQGYLLEVYVCQDNALIWMAVHTDHTSYEFTDEKGCKEKSSGLLYTVEKHGYSKPVKIPWPKASNQ